MIALIVPKCLPGGGRLVRRMAACLVCAPATCQSTLCTGSAPNQPLHGPVSIIQKHVRAICALHVNSVMRFAVMRCSVMVLRAFKCLKCSHHAAFLQLVDNKIFATHLSACSRTLCCSYSNPPQRRAIHSACRSDPMAHTACLAVHHIPSTHTPYPCAVQCLNSVHPGRLPCLVCLT